MTDTLDIALIQTRTPATAAAGLAHVEPLIRQAAAEGAQLILTPEGTNFLEQRRALRDAALSDEGADPAVAGLKALAAELGVWLLIGSAICYDLRFPHLHRALAQAGATLIAVPAAFTRPTGEAHWETLLRARAIETGAFVLAPAQGGTHEDGRQTWGRSLVVGPWGEVIARLDHDEPGVLHARLDLSAVEKARASVPALRHDRDFDLPL